MGQCSPSLTGQDGILYQCVKARTQVLQLVCPGDPFTCSGNTASGSCSVNSFQPSQCLFSSTAQRYVRITCEGSTVVTTITTGGGGRMLEEDAPTLDDLSYIEADA